MKYGYAAYSVHCDTLIKLSTLLTNYETAMISWLFTSIGQCLQKISDPLAMYCH